MGLAVSAVVDHAFDRAGLGLDRIAWQAYVGNWASRRVAERSGFAIEGTVRGHAPQRNVRRDAWVGSLLREDRAAARAAPSARGVAVAGMGAGPAAAPTAEPEPAASPPSGAHLVLWRSVGKWRAEHCEVTFSDGCLVASGTQVGNEPETYRLDYRLWTGPSYVTRRLQIFSTTHGWRRHLDLRRAVDGTWSCTADGEGSPGLPGPGGAMAALQGAFDCDVAGSPLTNSMPILRHGLHRGPGSADLLMAWVSVPDLGVHLSPQRYEHVRVDDDGGGAVVRYTGDSGRFVRELIVGPAGLVERYPGLAERVGPAGRSPASGPR